MHNAATAIATRATKRERREIEDGITGRSHYWPADVDLDVIGGAAYSHVSIFEHLLELAQIGAKRLLADPYRTFLLPGSSYGMQNHIRLGVGGGAVLVGGMSMVGTAVSKAGAAVLGTAVGGNSSSAISVEPLQPTANNRMKSPNNPNKMGKNPLKKINLVKVNLNHQFQVL